MKDQLRVLTQVLNSLKWWSAQCPPVSLPDPVILTTSAIAKGWAAHPVSQMLQGIWNLEERSPDKPSRTRSVQAGAVKVPIHP